MHLNGWKNFSKQQHCLHIHDTFSSKGMSQVGNSTCYFQLVNGCVFIMLVFWRFFFYNRLFQVQGQVFSEANCANLISTLITNLINQYQNLQSDFTNRVEISKASAALNGVRTIQSSSHVLSNSPYYINSKSGLSIHIILTYSNSRSHIWWKTNQMKMCSLCLLCM